MWCSNGYSWHGAYFYHSWIFWLILLLILPVAGIALYRYRCTRQKKCPNCRAPVEEAFLRCPECGHGLKMHCPHCSRIVETRWQYCPFCNGALHGVADTETAAGTAPCPVGKRSGDTL